MSPLIFIWGSRDKCKRGECRRGKQWGSTREDAARTPTRAGAKVSVPRTADGLEKGAEIKGREMAPRHPVRNEGCLHLPQAATSTCCGTQHCSAIGRVSKHSGNNPAATTFVFPRAGGGR